MSDDKPNTHVTPVSPAQPAGNSQPAPPSAPTSTLVGMVLDKGFSNNTILPPNSNKK
jgi:hypothetical protein